MTMTDIVKASPFMPNKPQWDATVKLLERALEELAQAQAERDAARAEVARMRAALTEADKSAQEMADEFYEVSEGAYLIDPVIFDAHRQAIRIALRQPAPAQTYPLDDEPCDNCVHGKKWHWDGGKCQNACPCEQYKPAPAGGEAK